ncbi:DNA repair exonuclease rad1 [Colletotrichum kahawae]|uniref:DNA repair exonuclease rad1 n=1 Tax=Colletotrichum kahawae TaxID=34407 RepID=A0AAE0D3P1_COLKA|nr:DNA repair exonuclease rad1 [Colletotrichum kahawae]
MDSSLPQIWQAAASTPFHPAVAKDSQFFIAFLLLLAGISITGVFALNRSFANIPALGVPASAAIAFGTVYMFCAAGAQPEPIFRAVASSTKPLYQLLKTINFTNKVHVQLQEDGTAFLDKKLFTTYSLNLGNDADGSQPNLPNFQIALPALLDTLQIFGAVDIATRTQRAEQDSYHSNIRNYRPDAFSNQALGIGGTCSLIYKEEGGQFDIVIEEGGVKTTASLTTYLPEIPEEIPFDRDNLSFKIIMLARYLLDALAELAPTGPNRLTIAASRASPYLTLSGVGDMGSSSVTFAKGRELLETFSIHEAWSQSYKFDLIKYSTEAMRIASKVSFRGDDQGVLSLQFMVEQENGISFLDFRFVPYISHDDDEDEENESLDDA